MCAQTSGQISVVHTFGLAVLVVVAHEGGADVVDGALGPRCVTRHVRMPVLFAVVAEVRAAPRPLALQLRTTRAPSRYHSITETHPINSTLVAYFSTHTGLHTF